MLQDPEPSEWGVEIGCIPPSMHNSLSPIERYGKYPLVMLLYHLGCEECEDIKIFEDGSF